MRILIVGQGGREHALAWKIAQSPQVRHVFVAPGHAGTQKEPKVTNLPIAPTAIDKLAAACREHSFDLIIVGPEAPLALGLANTLQADGHLCFAPTQKAAQLESSKVWAKDFMQRHGIPTAQSADFMDIQQASNYARQHPLPFVIKADGLAAGKGVTIIHSYEQAFMILNALLHEQQLGQAGQRVLIEEYLIGKEISFMVMVHNNHILPLAASQDHKARDNGNKGPNTGGMGAYSTDHLIDHNLHQRIIQQIIQPTLQGLQEEGLAYTGFLYAGLMITPQHELKVLEFNCRLGDPETQVVLMRLDEDFATLCMDLLHNKTPSSLHWKPQASVGVVLASGGYPGIYSTHHVIQGLPDYLPDNQKIFHAGTTRHNAQYLTASGRVLCATACGNSIEEARKIAYQLAQSIHWKDMFYRTDIGLNAL